MTATRASGVETARLEGILVVAKPPGPTSHDVVALVRRLTGVKRVGHGGTLDPFATGVLPVFLGRATRMMEYHMADAKRYRATVVFGARSTTDDLEGELTPSQVESPERTTVTEALAAFRGPIEQVPPDHSAVHVKGRRAYELARGGAHPVLAPRRVTVHALELVSWDGSHRDRPAAVLDLHCSAGTYVRALARDLGDRLGCGAYLGALTRTASGPFALIDAHPLEEVRERLSRGQVEELLLAPDAGLEHIPGVLLPAAELAALLRGGIVRFGTRGEHAGAGPVRVTDADGRLVAMARLEGGRLHPDKVFVDPVG